MISVVAVTVADLAQQYLLQTKEPLSERASGVIVLLIQSCLALPLVFLFNAQADLLKLDDPKLLIQFLLVALVGSTAVIFYFKSLKVKNISLSIILAMFSIVITTVLGIILFDESISWLKFAGIILVVIAIIVVQWQNAIFEKNHLFGLLAGLGFGIAYTLDKSIATTVHPLVYLWVGYFLTALGIFLSGPKDVVKSASGKPFKVFWPVIVSGLAYFFHNGSTLLAYNFGGEVGRIDAINNTQVFLIILFEFFILKEKSALAKKLVTAAIAFAGVVILGVV